MAKVKHIQVNELPQTLEANAIYFVRNTGEIWQTDANGVGVRMSVSKQYNSYYIGGYFSVDAYKVGIPSVNYSSNYITLSLSDSVIGTLSSRTARGFPVLKKQQILGFSINAMYLRGNGEMDIHLIKKKFKTGIQPYGNSSVLEGNILYTHSLKLVSGKMYSSGIINTNGNLIIDKDEEFLVIFENKSKQKLSLRNSNMIILTKYL